MNMEQLWNESDRGSPMYSNKKTCPSATLLTTNPIRTGLRSKLGLRGDRLATNRLSRGTVTQCHKPDVYNTNFQGKLYS
jgi:hypothetical protein